MSIIFSPNFRTKKTTIQKNDLLQNFDGNLISLALQLLKKTYKKQIAQLPDSKKFVQIIIEKNIPVSSGLGGASSDAAAVLKGLSKFWSLKIPTEKLLSLAAKLGMDVPFFILGGTAIGTRYGEKITPLPPLKNIKFKIFPTAASRSERALTSKTSAAYASLDLSLCGKNKSKTAELIKIIKNQSKFSKKKFTEKLQENIHNDFETLSFNKNLLKKGHHLSGSGPSTFKPKP